MKLLANLWTSLFQINYKCLSLKENIWLFYISFFFFLFYISYPMLRAVDLEQVRVYTEGNWTLNFTTLCPFSWEVILSQKKKKRKGLRSIVVQRRQSIPRTYFVNDFFPRSPCAHVQLLAELIFPSHFKKCKWDQYFCW